VTKQRNSNQVRCAFVAPLLEANSQSFKLCATLPIKFIWQPASNLLTSLLRSVAFGHDCGIVAMNDRDDAVSVLAPRLPPLLTQIVPIAV
jgi:hypothetical protein